MLFYLYWYVTVTVAIFFYHSTLLDSTSRINAQGAGYRAKLCDWGILTVVVVVVIISFFFVLLVVFNPANCVLCLLCLACCFLFINFVLSGEGPSSVDPPEYQNPEILYTMPGGGRGGCSIMDSGGGGGHFGTGGMGTKVRKIKNNKDVTDGQPLVTHIVIHFFLNTVNLFFVFLLLLLTLCSCLIKDCESTFMCSFPAKTEEVCNNVPVPGGGSCTSAPDCWDGDGIPSMCDICQSLVSEQYLSKNVSNF